MSVSNASPPPPCCYQCGTELLRTSEALRGEPQPDGEKKEPQSNGEKKGTQPDGKKLSFDCSRCENGFCGSCFQGHGEAPCRAQGKKRKNQPKPSTPASKKRKQNLSARQLSVSSDDARERSPNPLSSPQDRLTSSDPKAKSLSLSGSGGRSSKRPAQKRRSGAQLHLSYFSNASQSLLESGNMNNTCVDSEKCKGAEIQGTLQEMHRCLLLFVWRSIVTHIYSAPFLVPVKEAEAPDYSSVISHPMDLSTIRKKIDSMEYSSAEELLKDVDLMCENCRQYCTDRFPHLVPQAELVFDLCKESLLVLRPALENVESLLVDAAEGGNQTVNEAPKS